MSKLAGLQQKHAAQSPLLCKQFLHAFKCFLLLWCCCRQGDSGPDVDAKATELEKAVQPEKPLPDLEDSYSDALKEITLSLSSMGLKNPEEIPEVVGWRMAASAAKCLAFVHHGLGSANGGSGKGDPAMLRRASGAMAAGTLWAKTCKGMLAEFPRHVCVLEKGSSGGNVYQVKMVDGPF